MDLSQAVGQFSDDLFKLVVPKSHNENALVSPLSLSIAMSMLMAGAKNNSQLQLRNVLKLPAEVDVSEVHNCYNHLLTSYSELSKSNEAKEQILINNMALVSKLFGLLSEYERQLKVNYQAEIEDADFAKEGDKIVERVNRWVNNSTRGLIPTILKEPPAAETALILINCVYFKGDWMEAFTDAGNRDFHVSPSQVQFVPFMSKEQDYKYLQVTLKSATEFVEIVEIPYKGQTSMVLMLPPRSITANDLIVEKSLHEMLLKIVHSGRYEKIDLIMPKFTFKFNMKMNDIFKKLGAPDIFNSSLADLSAITGAQSRGVFVSDVTHTTVIEVDEKGTRAAAVTEATFVLTSFKPKKFLVLDRPFIFFIYDSTKRIPIFLGKLQDPKVE